MTRRLALALALLPLAACATATPDPQVGSVSHGGDTYAIHASAGDPSVWKLVIDGQTVLCRAATERDCYWSLRNFLASRAALDDLPG